MSDNCHMSKYLAWLMLTYVIASVYYFIRSRNIGTPFNDSLTKEQKKIKELSANTRRNVFLQGVIISVILIAIFKPFVTCYD